MNAATQHLLYMQALRDSIASVSLSHKQSCSCDTCKAAQGDKGAFARVVDSLGGGGKP